MEGLQTHWGNIQRHWRYYKLETVVTSKSLLSYLLIIYIFFFLHYIWSNLQTKQ
jgi:hypothetical protein